MPSDFQLQSVELAATCDIREWLSRESSVYQRLQLEELGIGEADVTSVELYEKLASAYVEHVPEQYLGFDLPLNDST